MLKRLWWWLFGYAAFKGVGVLYHPDGTILIDGVPVPTLKIAERLAEGLRQGSVLILPSVLGETGTRLWDFRIEGGPPNQIEVRHEDVAVPEVV